MSDDYNVPRAVETEANVLGTCLAEGSSWWQRLQHLMEGADEPSLLFYHPEHRTVAQAMQRVVTDRGNLNISSVTDVLLNDTEVNTDRFTPDLQTYLAQLQSRGSLRALSDLGEAVDTLNQKLQLRNQLQGLEHLRGVITGDQPHPNEVAAELRDLSMNAAVSEETRTFGEVIIEMEARDGLGVTHRIATGITELDTYFRGGFEPGRMYVIGARPKVGKTTLMLNMLLEALAQDSVVVFASLEIGERELWSKLVSAQSMVEQRAIQDMLDGKKRLSDFEPDEQDRIQDAMDGIKSSDLYTMFAGDLQHGVDSMISRTMRILQKHPGRPMLVIVDYLQLLSSETFNKAADIGAISRKMKLFAIENNLTIVAASQINRGGAEEGMPGPHHLRDSGSIEQDADVVMLLNRPALQDENQPEHIMDAWVALNRYGPSGFAHMAYLPHIQTIQDLELMDDEDDNEPRTRRPQSDDDAEPDEAPRRRRRDDDDDDDDDDEPRPKKDKKRKRRSAEEINAEDDEPKGRRSSARDYGFPGGAEDDDDM